MKLSVNTVRHDSWGLWDTSSLSVGGDFTLNRLGRHEPGADLDCVSQG